MTTLILSSVGRVAGTVFGGSVGGALGAYVGTSIGSYFDRKLFNLNKNQKISGYRLDDLAVQTSTYGKTIPIVYGKMRVSGNIIWSLPIKEVLSSELISQQYGKGFSRPKANVEKTNYNYYINMAIAICEGEIDGIERIWADNKLLDKSRMNFRLYRGTEEQNPDPFIQSIEGIGKTPAYRGLAYIVIENFQINEFGSHIPNFTFEVRRNLINEKSVEYKIDGVNMIPGSGEFVYDTTIQYKGDIINFDGEKIKDSKKKRINNNADDSNLSDAVVALNQMNETLPNVRYISVVVAWFANSLDIGTCQIYPAVESHDYYTSPDEWSVAGVKRDGAKIITKDKNGNPIYGGTISDKALINYVRELKKRNYKVILYPMIFLDLLDKPWRGRMTGSYSDVDKFFGPLSVALKKQTFSYNEFVLYYADLAKDYIDGFIIGSELKGITSIKDGTNNYPAVVKLIQLAKKVRDIIEPGVAIENRKKIITYAADWSEYHSVGGEYNLDSLWASDQIDVVGIDAYFPLTDIRSYSYQPNIDEIKDGWTSGEGYDYYYANGDRDKKIPYGSPDFAWKNIEYWWSNEHKDYPSGKKSPWKPKMKKIWFTEYGFPSIHGATNMPNIFYNPESSEGGLPVFSNGGINFDIQRVAIEATLEKWENSEMVERMLLWCYDARPYPYFPISKELWADGDLWTYGHWVNGKLGRCLLARIVEDLLKRIDLDNIVIINTHQLSASLDGFIINSNMAILDALRILQQCYFFDILEREQEIKFLARGYTDPIEIDDINVMLNGNEKQIVVKRNDEFEIPKSVNFSFFSSINDYDVRTANVLYDEIRYELLNKKIPQNADVLIIDVPICMNISYAESVANIILYSAFYQRDQYEVNLPLSYSYLEPGDLIKINDFTLKIISISHGFSLKIQAIIDDYALYYFRQNGSLLTYSGSVIYSERVPKTVISYGILPSMKGIGDYENSIIFAGCGEEEKSWRGAVGLNEKNATKFDYAFSINGPSNFGVTNNVFAKPDVNNLIRLDAATDTKTILYVQMSSGQLFSISDEEFNDDMNDENLIWVSSASTDNVYGEIAKFKDVELVAEDIYKLTNFKRGLFGTEYFVDKHEKGGKFIVIDERIGTVKLSDNDKGKKKKFRVVTLGDDLMNGEDIEIDVDSFYIFDEIIKNPRVSRTSDKKILIKWDFYKRSASFQLEIHPVYSGDSMKRYVVSEKQFVYDLPYRYPVVIIYYYSDGERRSFGIYFNFDAETGEMGEIGIVS